MAEKEVKVKVATDVEDNEVDALENQIQKLKNERLQFQIDTNTSKLEQVRAKIKELENQKATLDVDADDSEIQKINSEIERLKFEEIDLDLKVRQDQLEQTESKIDSMDPSQIEVDVNNQAALQAVDQIGQGFDRLKQGAAEVGEQMGTILEAAGKQETNKVFLEQAIGAEKAASAMGTINDAVAKLPGDDTVTATELENMGTAAADYFSAMSYYGKSSSEAFQDMNNYLLTGNTAEIERSPILANHIDKLKEATTIQERSKLLQEALNEEHWGGMSQQDTYNNKLETFNGMLERGKYNLGGLFQEGAKAGMDFVMQLDDASNGLVGMSIALASFASPITDTVMGLGQIATGFKSLKEASDLFGITNKLGALKTALMDVGGAAKNAALWVFDLGKKTLEAGYNALKSAALWAIEKAALVAQKIATAASAAAQWLLNAAMNANPVMLVVTAILILIGVLAYLYFNNEQVRTAIDGLGQSLIGLGQWVYNGAIYWLQQLQNTLMNLWNYITTLGGLLPSSVQMTGNQIIDSILSVLAFIATLPIQLGIIFINIIAKALGFGDNFAQNLIQGAINAVTGFINQIRQLPGMIQSEFARIESIVSNFITSLPQRVWDLGASIVGALKGALGIGSPGHMFYMFEGELERLDKLPGDMAHTITRNVSTLGEGIVDSFNPLIAFDDTLNGSVSSSVSSRGSNAPNVINLNIEVGTVDNDDRVREIVDAVRRELSWNNKTAGRTI